MKGLRTWRNLSETTAPQEISPKTRGLSWGECREVQKKKEKKKQRERHSLKKTKGPTSPAEGGGNNKVSYFSFSHCSVLCVVLLQPLLFNLLLSFACRPDGKKTASDPTSVPPTFSFCHLLMSKPSQPDVFVF